MDRALCALGLKHSGLRTAGQADYGAEGAAEKRYSFFGTRFQNCGITFSMTTGEPLVDAAIPRRLVGKPFDERTLIVIRREIKKADPCTRSEIARGVCRRLDWKSPSGKYQEMSARVGLLRLHRAGLIRLPAPTKGNGNGRRRQPRQVPLPKPHRIDQPVHELPGLALRRVEKKECSALYNALMDRHHYLGYSPMAGAQVRYLIVWEQGVLGAIGFGASAWKTGPRDRFIGWSRPVRHTNLRLILNNSRFLILPWVHSANLASKVLSLCARHIPEEFRRQYGYAPVLLESFVERDRFTGHCYRAANWVCVGSTQGRGKTHVYKTPGVPVKDIWLYPLRRDFRRILQGVQSQ